MARLPHPRARVPPTYTRTHPARARWRTWTPCWTTCCRAMTRLRRLHLRPPPRPRLPPSTVDPLVSVAMAQVPGRRFQPPARPRHARRRWTLPVAPPPTPAATRWMRYWHELRGVRVMPWQQWLWPPLRRLSHRLRRLHRTRHVRSTCWMQTHPSTRLFLPWTRPRRWQSHLCPRSAPSANHQPRRTTHEQSRATLTPTLTPPWTPPTRRTRGWCVRGCLMPPPPAATRWQRCARQSRAAARRARTTRWGPPPPPAWGPRAR